MTPVSGPAAPQKGRAIQWRVEGGAAALVPTAHVRIEMENALPGRAVHPRYGMVQSVVYLYSAGREAAGPLERAADDSGLSVAAGAEADEERVTVEVAGLDPEAVPLALVSGRPVKVRGAGAEETTTGRRRPGALRADPADLEDRRRWSADTLLLAGARRTLWEGTVPLEVDALYADYLAIRGSGDAPSPAPPGSVEARPPGPDPGILDLPPTQVSHAPPLPAGTTGATVTRAAGPRVFPLRLARGRLNVLRLRAVEDATGAQGLALQVTLADLPAPAP